MPTMNELRTEWKGIRSALGNLICYVDGKVAQLGEAEQTWQKGYDCGHKDGYEQGWSDCVDCEGKRKKTNREVFAEVFPEADGLSKLVDVMDAPNGKAFKLSKWWDEPYKEAEEGE